MARKRSRSPALAGRHALEYAALRLLAFLMGAMGTDAASGLMGRIWQSLGPRTGRHARVLANLRRAFPDEPDDRLAAIARQQWNNLGRTFAESFLIHRFFSDDSRVELTAHARTIFDGLENSGKGFVLVSLHSGNWELALMPVARTFRLTGLYQRISNPLADRYITAQRRQVFRGGLIAKGHSTPRTVMQIVRDGGGIGILADQRERKGVDVTFFGESTTANPFPAMIARRLGVPLIAGRAIRQDGARFIVDGNPIPVPVSDDAAADVQAATQAIQSQFETWIREYPGQWMWVHDRWKPARPRRRRKGATLDKSAPRAN